MSTEVDDLRDEIEELAEAVISLRTTLNNFVTRAQMRQLVSLKEKQLEVLRTEVDELEQLLIQLQNS